MSLIVRSAPPGADGVVIDVTPESAGWTYVGFRVVKLASGRCHDGGEADREACLVILSGTVDIVVGGEPFRRLGKRTSVFEGSPTSVYVPAGISYAITATDAAEVAICTAPGTGAGAVTLISAGEVEQEFAAPAPTRAMSATSCPTVRGSPKACWWSR